MKLLAKNVLFTLLLPGTVAVYLPLAIAAGRPPATGPVLAVASIVLCLGLAIYSACVWDFATVGRATPAPIDAPRVLVSGGLYRYTRNPMYVGVLTVIGGWAVLYRDARLVLYALVVWTCFHLFTVLYEEPHLAGEFGEQYAAYCSRVPRWLPRLGTPPISERRGDVDGAER